MIKQLRSICSVWALFKGEQALATTLVLALVMLTAQPVGAGNALIDDDFDNQASADPPGGWERTISATKGVSEETSDSSSVELSGEAGSVRLISTGMTCNPQDYPQLILTVEIDAVIGSDVEAIGGITSNNNECGFYVNLFQDGTLKASSVKYSPGEKVDVTTLEGYDGGPVTITAALDSEGFTVSAAYLDSEDAPHDYSRGEMPWDTFGNGFGYDDLGTEAMALLQVTKWPYGTFRADFGRITLSAVVPDTTPPTVEAIMADPGTLWPPNHKMVDVEVAALVTDDGSGVDPESVMLFVDDEYDELYVEEPIPMFPDPEDPDVYWAVISLEASRDGKDRDGRYYDLSVLALDNNGNFGESDIGAFVLIPHDQGKKK